MQYMQKIRESGIGIYTAKLLRRTAAHMRPRTSEINKQWLPSKLFTKQISGLLRELRLADAEFYEILHSSAMLHEARQRIISYLNQKESLYYDSRSVQEMPIVERCNAKECIRVFKNILCQENEARARFSALNLLHTAVRNKSHLHATLTPAFLGEIISLLYGINGHGFSFLFQPYNGGQTTSVYNGARFSSYAGLMESAFKQFSKGLDAPIVIRQSDMKRRILAYYNAKESDWLDYHWHLQHLFTTKKAIASIVRLSPTENAGLEKAEKENIPVQITPYYLSLFNPQGPDVSDRAIRAQVIPTAAYCSTVAENRKCRVDMDYMGEQQTSPIAGITRRYPHIAILKPFDSCPQICVYCQRNWEIRDLAHGTTSDTVVNNALQWIRDHHEITEVLVTGGDPLVLENDKLGAILDQLADIEHIERIRIGTRALVTMPSRIDSGFLGLLSMYHKPGRREIAIMTHVEHSSELTFEVVAAVAKIRFHGVAVYNQQVFTYYNSRKFESAFLRKNLRLCGIDPYYMFNTKGKEETSDFRVPIARLLQESKEEARLLPGIMRTDEPVFNVPRIGKSHLRAWQDHEPIMILADGRRVYRFLPWDSRLIASDDYLYTDVSIYDYLKRLYHDGEDVDQYRSIWYYF